jgi:hypothetical protein
MSQPLDEFGPDRAAEVLTAALSGPGTDSVLASFADVPGAVFVAGRPGGLLRRAEPARLDVGQWRFVAGQPPTVSHVVRDVVLKTSAPPLAEVARLLADAVLDAAGAAGPAATSSVQAVFYGMAVVHGLA